MTHYKPEQTRRILKTEQAEFVQDAIDRARTAQAQHEGSRRPTGRTIFYVKTPHEALERFADLKTEGWTLDTDATVLLQAPGVPLSFTAIKPEAIFDKDIPLIAEYAESAYVEEVERHNREAKRLQERAEAVKAEFERQEEARKAALMVEIAKQYDSNLNPRYVNSEATKLHA